MSINKNDERLAKIPAHAICQLDVVSSDNVLPISHVAEEPKPVVRIGVDGKKIIYYPPLGEV